MAPHIDIDATQPAMRTTDDVEIMNMKWSQAEIMVNSTLGVITHRCGCTNLDTENNSKLKL